MKRITVLLLALLLLIPSCGDWIDPKEETAAGENAAQEAAAETQVPLTKMVSALTESLNVESCRTLFPVYYEQALQNRYSRDPESIGMINLLTERRYFDFSTLFSLQITGISTLFRDVINSGLADFASKYKSLEKASNKGPEKVLDAYEKNQGN